MRRQETPRRGQETGGAVGRHELKTFHLEPAREIHRSLLVGIAQRQQRRPAPLQIHAGAFLGARISLGEAVADTHHFAGGFHFRAENRIAPGHAGEWKNRLLHRKIGRARRIGDPLLIQRAPHHDQRRHLGELYAHRLGHIGNAARGARVHFQHVDIAVLKRELHVHQTAHAQRLGHQPVWRASSSCTSSPAVAGGRQQAESPEWTPACSMCSMIPPIRTLSPS